MSTEQLHRTSIVISDLQRSLDVFEGVFVDNLITERLFQEFPEIGVSLQEAMIAKLLITTSAIFCDNATIDSKDTLSLNNLKDKYGSSLSDTTRDKLRDIDDRVSGMNLRGLRNGYVAHLSLEIALGNKTLKSHISVNKLRKVYELTQECLELIGKETGLLKENDHMCYYTLIPDERSAGIFSKAIDGIA